MGEHDSRSLAFPVLDLAQMAALDRCPLTTLKRCTDGEKLFDVGDRDLSFFVVKSGAVEIVDESGETPRAVVVLGPGEFTGDVTQLTGGPAIVNVVPATSGGRGLKLRGDHAPHADRSCSSLLLGGTWIETSWAPLFCSPGSSSLLLGGTWIETDGHDIWHIDHPFVPPSWGDVD